MHLALDHDHKNLHHAHDHLDNAHEGQNRTHQDLPLDLVLLFVPIFPASYTVAFAFAA